MVPFYYGAGAASSPGIEIPGYPRASLDRDLKSGGRSSVARDFNPPSYTLLAQSWILAPAGAKACSLGRQPQEGDAKRIPEPRRGDGRSWLRERLPSPLRGSGLLWARRPGADAPGYMPLPLPGQKDQTPRLVYKRVDFNPGRNPGRQGESTFNSALAAAVRDWHQRLDRVEIKLPPAAEPLVHTFRTALAHILINRDGPAIQPGSRSYARAWIRDGVAHLLRPAALRSSRSRRPRASSSGSPPTSSPAARCPAAWTPAAPIPFRRTTATANSSSWWPSTGAIPATARLVEQALAARREGRRLHRRAARASAARTSTAKPDKLRYFGLLPESISHEGYSAHPVHSYWDDFFALTGLKDAVDLASGLGKTDEADALGRQPRRIPHRPLRLAQPRDRPSAEASTTSPAPPTSRDFDATSTTIALSPGGELANLRDKLRAAWSSTFERYWKEFEQRRTGTDWKDYTPYELRTVGTFVRLGWTERAHELLDFFLEGPPAAGLEPVARGGLPRPARSPASSAISRTPGSARTSSAPSSTSSPTSATPIRRWSSPPASRIPGSRPRGQSPSAISPRPGDCWITR